MPDENVTRRLRDAADALSPPFSPAVHDAVMRRVRLAVPPTPAARPPAARPPVARPPVAGWAAVAAVVLVAAGLLWRAERPVAPRPIGTRAVTVPSMPRWSSPVAVASWAGDGGYADLDRDAGRAARFLIGQLAAVPTVPLHTPASRPAGPRVGA